MLVVDKEALYYVLVGLILVASGAWAYSYTGVPASLDESLHPRECGNLTFPLDPAYLVLEYETSAVGFNVGDLSPSDLGGGRVSILVTNDPCREGYATVVVVSGGGIFPPQNLTLEELATIIAPEGSLEPGAAAATGLGVAGAGLLEAPQDLRPGPVPGSIYLVDGRAYYEADTGVLAKRESTWIRLGGPGPDYAQSSLTLQDLLKSRGPGGDLQSYSKSVEALAAYSLASAIGLVAGTLSIAYAAWQALNSPSKGGVEEGKG